MSNIFQNGYMGYPVLNAPIGYTNPNVPASYPVPASPMWYPPVYVNPNPTEINFHPKSKILAI